MFLTLTRWVTKALETVIVVSLALMAILVFGNVVLRYAFDSGIAVSEELAWLFFVWLIFLGAILAFAPARPHRLRHPGPPPAHRLKPSSPGAAG